MSITVLNPGLLTTVQDMGRVGYQQFGVSVSGVMDPRSAAIANILVGNPEDEAVLECTMMGPQLLFNQTETIAITGGDLMPTLDGKPMPTYRAVTVQAGQVLRFQARWGDLLAKGDPCTNPNFDIQREDFSLKILPLE